MGNTAAAPAQQVYFEVIHRPCVARFSDFFQEKPKISFPWVTFPEFFFFLFFKLGQFIFK